MPRKKVTKKKPPAASSKEKQRGVQGAAIKQDKHALFASLIVGRVTADIEFLKRQYPEAARAKKSNIAEPTAKAEFERLEKLRKNLCRGPRKMTTELRKFMEELHIDFELPEYGMEHVARVQEAWKGQYRILLLKHDGTNRKASIEFKGDAEAPRAVYIVKSRDGHFNPVVSPAKLLGALFCPMCGQTATKKSYHRCPYTCTLCGEAGLSCEDGTEPRECDDCHFVFHSIACHARHKKKDRAQKGARCDVIKACPSCNVTYRVPNLKGAAHECGVTTWCWRCKGHFPPSHECMWEELTEAELMRKKKKQENFRWAFYDMETSQAVENEEGDFTYLSHHYAVVIVLGKICHKCHEVPDEEAACPQCGPRYVTFQYKAGSDGRDVVTSFFEYITEDETMAGRIILAHNGARFDHHLLCREMIAHDMFPKLLSKGTTIMSATFAPPLQGGRRLQLKDTYLQIPYALAEFQKSFELEGIEDKGTFPHMLTEPKNFGKTWTGLPAKRYYGYDLMSDKKRKAFDEWYSSVDAMYHFDFDQEIAQYCLNDVRLVLHGTMKYRQIMMEATGFCPITQANTTGAFVLFLLRASFLPRGIMPYLPENGYGVDNQSEVALRTFALLEHKLQRPLVYAGHPKEHRVEIDGRLFKIDCFDASTEQLWEYYGCFWHGCPECFPERKRMNDVVGETMQSLYDRTMSRERLLRRRFPKVNVIWEHEVPKLLADPADELFFKTTKVKTRLSPRASVQGGRTDAYVAVLNAEPGRQIRHVDVVSMYPAMQMFLEFPIGHPSVKTEGFGNVEEWKEVPYKGLIQCVVMPPLKLIHPVLGIKSRDSLIFGLCQFCIENKVAHCAHFDPEKRALSGCWTDLELNHALQRGYKILEVWEAWTWDRWEKGIYEKYVTTFLKLKLQSSKFPLNPETHQEMTTEEKQAFLDKYKELYGIDLRIDEVVFSAARRLAAKIALNSGWGKLAENPQRISTEYVTTDQLMELRKDTTKTIVEFQIASDEYFLVKTRPRQEAIHSNRFSNLVHAALITSGARLHLLRFMEKVQEGGGEVAYTDTDSVVYTCPEGSDPLANELGGLLGELTSELEADETITKAVFAGPKNYSYVVRKTGDGKTVEKIKVRGFTMDKSMEELITLETMEKAVRATLRGEEVRIPVKRAKMERAGTGTVRTVEQVKVYRVVHHKATLGEDMRFRPFGYIDE